MARWIKTGAIVIVCLIAVLALGAWLLLTSSILAKQRGDLTAKLLSSKLNQTVLINDGVTVDLGSVLLVQAKGLALPSPSLAETNLAEIGALDFGIVLSDLLKGRIDLRDLRVDGARVALVVDQEGVSSWQKDASARQESGAEPENTGSRSDSQKGVLSFLSDHRIRFADANILYRDARNGLDLDLRFGELDISQTEDDAPVAINGTGNLNGEDLILTGSFAPGKPSQASIKLDQIALGIDGQPDEKGYSTNLTLEVAELGQLLDVLKLERTLGGTGQVSAVLRTGAAGASLNDLKVDVTLDGGQSLEVRGDMGRLGDPDDVTIATRIRLYGPDNRPPPTRTRRELKLIGVDMTMESQPGKPLQRGMVIETNGFTLDTKGEGPAPISVSGISRTPDGKLKLGKLELRIGPPAAPFVILDGPLEDALQLKGADFRGVLAIPAASLLAPELFQDSTALGTVAGGFHLGGGIEKLSLTDLDVTTEGTDLWSLDVTGGIENALRFSNVSLDVDAEIPSGAALLEALGLKPIESGPVGLAVQLRSQDTKWSGELTVKIQESRLDATASVDVDDPHPIARGEIVSDLIRIEHIRDIVAASVQFSRLDELERAASEGKAKADQTTDGNEVNSEHNGAETDQPGPIRDSTLLPLGRAVLASGLDLDVLLDLRKIEGDKGTTSLTTDLEMRDQKARFGPLKFEYAEGHFELNGSMDLKEKPDILELSGSTGGWDFGKIMQELQFKKPADGTLYADFELSGKHTSVQDFLGSLNGFATVSMRNGSIDTQLLDIAGLGILPWLFSKDKGPTAPIVCARAPMAFSGGRISTKQTVVETDQVQVVVFGHVDLNGKSLDINGQPRQIGKPLSKSPWPFTAKGSFADPKIKVKDGPKRLKRKDGAKTMPKKRKLCVPDILQLQ